LQKGSNYKRDEKNRRYQIELLRRVSGIIFIRDVQSRKIGKPNNLTNSGSY